MDTDQSLGRERFAEAGKRLAQENFAGLTVAPPKKDGNIPEAQRFADGWPYVDWANTTPVLRFSGVTDIIAPTNTAPPRCETRSKDGIWTPVTFESGGKPTSLPADTIEVRYGWGDSTTGLHQRVFSQRPEGNTFIPAFYLKKP